MSLIDFLSNTFSENVWIIVIIVAMIPTLESKIAIPLAINKVIWGSNVLGIFPAFLLAYIGSIIPCYFILLIFRKIKNKSSLVFVNKYLTKYISKSYSVSNKDTNIKKCLSLMCFVAIPLPLTGVWSGSIVAGLSNLNLGYCFLLIAFGALISAGVTSLFCTLFTNSVVSILMISLIIVIVFLFIDILIELFKKRSPSI